MKKIKIRFLINTLNYGGAEKCLIDLLNNFNDQQYEVCLMVVNGGAFSSEVSTHVQYKELVSSKIKNKKIYKLLTKIVYKMPATLFKILFLRKRYDIECAYMQGFATRAISKLTKRKGVKTYTFVHTDLSKTNFIVRYYPSKEKCLKEYGKFSKVCFVSQTAKIGFEKAVGLLDNASIVHNVIDKKRIIQASEEECSWEFSTNGLKLITVGRLIEAKNYTSLLRICAQLEKEFDFELFIVGDGEERKKLEDLIKEDSIKSVKLLGFARNPYPLLRKADLFVCSSIREGYSTAVVEALTLGLPVITTDVSGMDEILDNGKYGMIVANNEVDLYNGLKLILGNQEVFKNLQEKANQYNMFNKRNSFNEYKSLF